ncbi:hypothetical protein BCU17_13265 [Vibrio splendidus]|uniref:Peptidase M12B domain-containing protein n=1 Tax=Vibrio splendidus TaxID=29497 RepID=A0A2N7FJM8_VIBSP|nr:hypothetical protein [Vibrio splendidus]PMJ69498.1 hypothetical protein BCU17_13265 [Vibrio splendidus]
MKSKIFITFSVVIFIILAFIYRFNSVDRTGLVLPNCTIENIIDTEIDFYITSDIFLHNSHNDIKNRIYNYIYKANTILKNSCIPIKRKLGKLELIDTSSIEQEELETIKFQPIQLARVAKEILKILNKDDLISYYNNKPTRYFVIVYGEKFRVNGSTVIGNVNPNISNSMVILDYAASNHHLEHELGHLAGALHKNSDRAIALRNFYLNFSDKDDILKPYSGGTTCSGNSTIMYNGGSSVYPNLVLDVYSSPNIKFNGKPCGDIIKANNQRVMLEYAKILRSKLQ